MTQHKGSKTLAFKPLAQALGEPGEFLLSDFSKVGAWRGMCVCVRSGVRSSLGRHRWVCPLPLVLRDAACARCIWSCCSGAAAPAPRLVLQPALLPRSPHHACPFLPPCPCPCPAHA